MIHILNKADCCGCTACFSVCPKHCISMKADSEGFVYPEADPTNCIDCGLCEKVCPVLNQADTCEPLAVYAAYTRDCAIRQSSSSGGLFTLIAQKVIDKGGVVFGARFDENFDVIHDRADKTEGLKAFRGSKYVQSSMLDNYTEAKSVLETGRDVLFSGTPCQIAGLRRYLRKKYSNLLTVDCVCHGVPSPMVWRSYLAETSHDPAWICFRNKRRGWKKYDVTIADKYGNVHTTTFDENHYMQIFLSDLSLRPSCYNCPSKNGKSMSDITLGDFWGIETISPDFDDDKGCSLLIVNTLQGHRALIDLDITMESHDIADAKRGNPSLSQSAHVPAYRHLFMSTCRRYGFKKAYALIKSQAFHYRLLRRTLLPVWR